MTHPSSDRCSRPLRPDLLVLVLGTSESHSELVPEFRYLLSSLLVADTQPAGEMNSRFMDRTVGVPPLLGTRSDFRPTSPRRQQRGLRAVADATPPPLVRDLRIVFPNKDVTGEIVAVACIDPRFRISARDGRWPTLEKCWYL